MKTITISIGPKTEKLLGEIRDKQQAFARLDSLTETAVVRGLLNTGLQASAKLWKLQDDKERTTQD